MVQVLSEPDYWNKFSVPRFLFATNPAIQEPDGNIKLVAMSFITESLQKKASAIIAELPTQFSTRLFIWKLADEHEHDYIEMLIAATKTEKTRSFHSLHAQIGTYLLDHSDELGIIKLDIREKNVNPFGRITESQLWEKL